MWPYMHNDNGLKSSIDNRHIFPFCIALYKLQTLQHINIKFT